jgi:hypothetical protein
VRQSVGRGWPARTRLNMPGDRAGDKGGFCSIHWRLPPAIRSTDAGMGILKKLGCEPNLPIKPRRRLAARRNFRHVCCRTSALSHMEFETRSLDAGVFPSSSGGDSCGSPLGLPRGRAGPVSNFESLCFIRGTPPDGRVQKFRARPCVAYSKFSCYVWPSNQEGDHVAHSFPFGKAFELVFGQPARKSAARGRRSV